MTRWRMNVALMFLQNSAASVAEIAAQIGYESEAAFSRAFKRSFGAWPSQARSREFFVDMREIS